MDLDLIKPSMPKQEGSEKSAAFTNPLNQSLPFSDPHHHILHHLHQQQQQPPLQYLSPNTSVDTNSSQSFLRQRPIGPIRRVADKNALTTAAGDGSEVGAAPEGASSPSPNQKTGNMFLDLTTPPTRRRIPSLRSPTKQLSSAGNTPDAGPHSPARSGSAASSLAAPGSTRRGAPRSVTPTKAKVAPEVRASTLPRKKKEPAAVAKNSLMSTSAHATAGGVFKGGNSSRSTASTADDVRSKTLPLPGNHAKICLCMA